MSDIHQDIYNHLSMASAALAPMVAKLNETDAEIKAIAGDRKRRESEKQTLAELKHERTRLALDIDKRRGHAIDHVNRLVDSYEEQRRKETAVNPEHLTDDYRLIESGTPLKERDIIGILDRSEGNATMQQVAHRYAQEHGIELPQEYVYMGDSEIQKDIDSARDMAGAAKIFVDHHMGNPDGAEMLDRFFVDDGGEGR